MLAVKRRTFTKISEEIGLTNAYTAQLFYNQVCRSVHGKHCGHRWSSGTSVPSLPSTHIDVHGVMATAGSAEEGDRGGAQEGCAGPVR